MKLVDVALFKKLSGWLPDPVNNVKYSLPVPSVVVAVGHRNGERYQYTTFASKVLEYLALPKHQRPSREEFQGYLFPSEEPNGREFLKDDDDTKTLLSRVYSNVYTHNPGSFFGGVDAIAWKRSPSWTPEDQRYILYFLEVKGRTRDISKGRHGPTTKIKIQRNQPHTLVERLREFRHEIPLSTETDNAKISISSAFTYVACVFCTHQGNPRQPVLEQVVLLSPQQIFYSPDNKDRIRIPPGWNGRNKFNNAPYYPISLRYAMTLAAENILVPVTTVEPTDELFINEKGLRVLHPHKRSLPRPRSQEELRQFLQELSLNGISYMEEEPDVDDAALLADEMNYQNREVEVAPGVRF